MAVVVFLFIQFGSSDNDGGSKTFLKRPSSHFTQYVGNLIDSTQTDLLWEVAFQGVKQQPT